MRTRQRATISDLRLAIDCLPRDTKIAMLEGITTNEIIVGAYSDGDGICPMLAAHRAGGRTSFISFARAWDRFAFRGARVRVSRRATDREMLVLRTHLEASLMEADGAAPDLAAAMADHRQLVDRRARERADGARSRAAAGTSGQSRHERPGDSDRSKELRKREGWAWLRVFRRYDEYERALELVHAEKATLREHELV